MTLAARAGITVVQTQLIPLVGFNAVAIRRFDRERNHRIHSISAGTAIRAATASGAEPQMGYPELARILRRVGVAQDGVNQRDARELFRRMVFNILMDNTDDHEKNHALLVVHPYDNGKLKLAPAYDVLPTHSGQGYQECRVRVRRVRPATRGGCSGGGHRHWGGQYLADALCPVRRDRRRHRALGSLH